MAVNIIYRLNNNIIKKNLARSLQNYLQMQIKYYISIYKIEKYIILSYKIFGSNVYLREFFCLLMHINYQLF